MSAALFLALSVLILLLSVIIHEVCHGLAALYFGDHTAENAGRLTLNPLPHIDPIGTLILPLVLILPYALRGMAPPIVFGWAKPVPVSPLNFRNLRQGELVVSLAGVAANFGLAIIGSIIIHLLGYFTVQAMWYQLVNGAINVNLALMVFNLVPIPPLDGSKVLLSQLPYELAHKYMAIERYGPFLLLALIMLPVAGFSLIDLLLGITVPALRTLLFL